MKKYHSVLAIMAIAIIAVVTSIFTQGAPTVGASGQTITPFTIWGNSTTTKVLTSSTLVDATNTALVYRQLSNLSTSTIYCSGVSPVAAYTGMAIFASSTQYFKVDENPYNGPIYCIAPNGAASTTLIEK